MNELSIFPISKDRTHAITKIIGFLNTMRELRIYGFNIIRTHDNFYAEELYPNYTISDFINDKEIKLDLRILLRSIVKNPFIEYDQESYEVEAFIKNEFEVENSEGEILSSEGIASAYIFNSNTVSLENGLSWAKSPLTLIITDLNNYITKADIVNFWNIQSVQSWNESLLHELPLNNEDNIRKIFPSDKFEFDKLAIEQLISWHYDDIRFQKRIRELIFDIAEFPFIGGKGHTEILKEGGGIASKRIIKKDRIVYTYTEEKIIIHQCKGHYADK